MALRPSPPTNSPFGSAPLVSSKIRVSSPTPPSMWIVATLARVGEPSSSSTPLRVMVPAGVLPTLKPLFPASPVMVRTPFSNPTVAGDPAAAVRNVAVSAIPTMMLAVLAGRPAAIRTPSK
jgi:hypothetical protein